MNRLATIALLLVLAAQTLFIAYLGFSQGQVEKRPPIFAGPRTVEEVQATINSLSKEKIAEFEARERDAILREPLDRSALQNLAVLAEIRGEATASKRLSRILADYGRRSVVAQLPAARFSLEERDFRDAWDRIDGILRAHPELGDSLFPLIVTHLPHKTAESELVRVLGKDPPWRRKFLKYLSETAGLTVYAHSLLTLLNKSGFRPADSEIRGLIAQLVNARNYESAYFVWLDLLAESDLRKARHVFDGNFESEPRNLFFDWNIPSRKNARHELIGRPGKATDLYLAFDFHNETKGGPVLFQYLRLLAGAYNLSYDFQIEQLKSETGLVWRIYCVGAQKVLVETLPMSGTAVWQTLHARFEVPEQDCQTQVLRLENKSTAVLDQILTGRLLVDNVIISESN